ncbi:MAG: ABC transporter permease, partial [Gemmatimonadota bacterium]
SGYGIALNPYVHMFEGRFGDTKRVRHSLQQIERQRGRRVRWTMGFDELRQDVRYGIRGLLKRPGFTLAATVSLALGLATVTIAYSIVDAYLFRPLAVANPDELVVIGSRIAGPPAVTSSGIAYPNYLALRERRDLLTDVAGYAMATATFRATEDATGEVGTVFAVTGSYFPMLGVTPQLGRLLAESDDQRGEPTLVLTDAYWRRRLGADPAVLGRTARLNGKLFTIVGVTPPTFNGTMPIFSPGFVPWSSLPVLEPAARDRTVFDTWQISPIARKPPVISLSQLRAGLDVASRDLERQFPKQNQGLRMIAYPESRARPSLFAADAMPMIAGVMLGLALLVLVVACANVANLVLVRVSSRRNELGVRQALGASRGRMIQQLLTESVVLGLAGLLLGWWLAWAGIRWLAGLNLVPDFEYHLVIAPDWRVFAFAGVVALGAGILVGVIPAFGATRGGLRSMVGEGARAIGGGKRHRNILVTAQLAVSLVVLVVAGLLARSVQQSAGLDLGFKPDRVLKAGLAPNLAGYDEARGQPLLDRVIVGVRALPGVRQVAWATFVPLQGSNVKGVDAYLDRPVTDKPDGDHTTLLANWISGEYFDVMGIRLNAGRTFTVRDDSLAPRVAIVNAAAAKLFWPDQEPVGQRFRTARDSPLVEVVGVAPDGRYLFVGEAPRPFVYLPVTQQKETGRILVVATTGEPSGLIGAVRAVVASVDPNLVPIRLETMATHVGTNSLVLLLRLAAMLTAAIGILALIQASLGLYGVIAYSVAQQAREIGIRVALGAEPRGVLRLIIGEGGRLIAIGLVLGVLAALAAGRLLQGLLVGVGTTDLVTFGTAAGVLGGVGLLATYVPARRAARLDPVKALRSGG